MRNIITPPPLLPGDTIGIFAPSSWVERDDIERSTAFLEQRGYHVFIHPQTYERFNQSAGTHLQKALAFQGLWQRDNIDAIWAAGGGNRCLHLLETINFKPLIKKPKSLIGFSDVTALLNATFAHTDIVTFHGTVFKNLHKHKHRDHILDVLAQKEPITYPMTTENVLYKGQAQGHLIGGNLSIFQYLTHMMKAQTPFYENGILFLEDCNEELSRIDRMLLHLRNIGVFNSINALILGQFTPTPESGTPFGYTLKDIIAEHTDGLDIPIIHDMPFGHGDDLYCFPIGAQASIDTHNHHFSADLNAHRTLH